MNLLSFRNFHIDVKVISHNNFYGNPDTTQMSHAWTLLRRLHGLLTLPWLCGGDFNEITSDFEKIGGNPKPRYLMNNFRVVLDHCCLADLGFRGPKLLGVIRGKAQIGFKSILIAK
ncbi:hypothetical protein ACOSQ4_005480 [Xanthoceras sorbifolium]